MLSTRLLTRGNASPYAAMISRLHTSTILFDSSSSSSSDSDEKQSKKKKSKVAPVVNEEQKLKSRQETTERLNSLLENMLTKPKTVKTIEHTVAVQKTKKPKVQKQRYEAELFGAAKAVATSLGGDEKKTESELLNKLLAIESSNESEVGKTGAKKSAPLNLKDFIAGMNIDRTPREPKKSNVPSRTMDSTNRSAQVQSLAKKFQSLRPATSTSRRSEGPRRYGGPSEPGNLYDGDCLNIFDMTPTASETDAPRLTTWETLEKKEFKLALTHPPENIFQEMIMWTEQGKLWKFPIDNEQGLEEEQSIHFSEHVFMERHLKDWCPKRGPIRHFMQLVCVGLSKNPYMTVQEKQEHIAWYRDFFASKQELLKEIGAIEAPIPQRNEISA